MSSTTAKSHLKTANDHYINKHSLVRSNSVTRRTTFFPCGGGNASDDPSYLSPLAMSAKDIIRFLVTVAESGEVEAVSGARV